MGMTTGLENLCLVSHVLYDKRILNHERVLYQATEELERKLYGPKLCYATLVEAQEAFRRFVVGFATCYRPPVGGGPLGMQVGRTSCVSRVPRPMPRPAMPCVSCVRFALQDVARVSRHACCSAARPGQQSISVYTSLRQSITVYTVDRRTA